MGICCSLRRSWKLHLEVVGDEGKIERQPYMIELISKGSSNGAHFLKINNVQQTNVIYDNLCSPLCCRGGAHEWEDKGHFFRLELPSVYIKDSLYVDGCEVETKKNNASTWVDQFLVFVIFGALVFVAGVVLTALSPETVGWSSSRYFGVSCIVAGFLTMLPGVIGLARAQSVNIKTSKMKNVEEEPDQDITQL